jgi:Xaa-Pro aminopeptidase
MLKEEGMGVSNTEFERRYAAIREQMKQGEMDCLLVVGAADDFNRGNIRYITGHGRGGCCIFPSEGKPVFLMGPGQAASPKISKTVEAHELLDLRETDNPAEQAVKEISGFYRDNNVGIIGMNCISVPMHQAVVRAFENKITDAMKIFESARAVKSPEEIERQRRAAAIADEVHARLIKTIRPGMNDYEIYGLVKKTNYEMGCEYSFDLIDASGSRMNMTFGPTGDKLKADNTLFMEITPAFEGYYAQLPVTLPVGRPPAVIKKMAGAWEKANAAGLKILRPGTRVADLYDMLVDTVKENGFVSPLRPGHAIGLDALDFWSITGTSEIVLQAGMVIAMHPCIMTKMGGDACGMGYTFLITDNGAERFSKVELAGDGL